MIEIKPANLNITATEEKSSTLGTIKDMAALPDLSIWVGYKNGYLERYCNNGRYTYRTLVFKLKFKLKLKIGK